MTALTTLTPYTLFQRGMDTMEIAAFLGCSEATAYNAIHEERNAATQDERFRTYQRKYRQRIRAMEAAE